MQYCSPPEASPWFNNFCVRQFTQLSIFSAFQPYVRSFAFAFCFLHPRGRMVCIEKVQLERKRGEGDASSLNLNLTDPCRAVPFQYHCLGIPCRPAGWETVSVYCLREYNAESPKQCSKRFNSQGRRNTFPIWLYNLSMMVCQKRQRRKEERMRPKKIQLHELPYAEV